jgi:gliding motility-associated-like protein
MLFICQKSYYFFTLSKADVQCGKGSAGIQIDTLKTTDTLQITWSNGQTDVYTINNLEEGNYSVHVIIKNKKDTTLNFKIEKQVCPVLISNHFTPNGDNYNDTWQIANISNYPKFELFVFNKWGQQIHSQKGNYTPWDGNWNGIKVPDGTYYYVFYYESGKNDILKGDVTILR